MAKEEKKRFGIRSYRVRYTIELLTFTILVCLIMGNTIYNQAAAIIQANLSDNVTYVLQCQKHCLYSLLRSSFCNFKRCLW